MLPRFESLTLVGRSVVGPSRLYFHLLSPVPVILHPSIHLYIPLTPTPPPPHNMTARPHTIGSIVAQITSL
ncbi:hypothetical protein Pmani_007801 [Petrolisthes manimaculis]|uniref:Uncharacterized protein n=1 Tax=Petrolisthes manimaculis TaxID=1843537 RepID=A0AAE1UFA1_9EUCA|nr:hypothetical protein Pmani_007801 [Petrolisthes manimaculis]